mmetsp:Transcript_20503/g.34305  ORF Transcript_20503/g.34305 Transcript_20503/m.34305 type:complete len:392 (-) Transcript_20503:81-1256(-)
MMPREDLMFGKSFSDHMLEVDWDADQGWHDPVISKYHFFNISPAATALHYGIECFEGMKAYKDANGDIRLFRPEKNMARFNSSMERLAMPTLDQEGFLACLKALLRQDASWVPEGEGYSIYIRPTAIGTSPYLGVEPSNHVKVYAILSPVGPYYKSGFKPVKLFADTTNARAWPGGVGAAKVGGNYGPTILPSKQASEKHGSNQVLWLYGEDHQITEVGAMNIFFVLKKRDSEGGAIELVTAPLTRGDILAGVTRDSILALAREWYSNNNSNSSSSVKKDKDSDNSSSSSSNSVSSTSSTSSSSVPTSGMEVSERWLTMREVVEAEKEGRLLEAFGAGTAVVVSPVRSIVYDGAEILLPTGESAGPVAQCIWDTLRDIQYGHVDHPWSVVI